MRTRKFLKIEVTTFTDCADGISLISEEEYAIEVNPHPICHAAVALATLQIVKQADGYLIGKNLKKP